MDFREFQTEEKQKKNSIMLQVTEQDTEEVAIIGMSFMLPGACTKEELWNMLEHGGSAFCNMPELRVKHLKEYADFLGKSFQTPGKAAYLENISGFDNEFFHITKKEAELMDPNQRLFLMTTWHMLEDAGYAGGLIKGTNTGVYVGYGDNNYYYDMIKEVEPDFKRLSVVGNLKSVISARLANILDLKGATMNIDTACSSSLVALHLACEGIRNGDCDMAIAGGVRIFLSGDKEQLQIGIESKSGSVKPFAQEASGTIWGEGVISFLLKPFYKAKKDRDNIYAVIKGSAVNQDGNTTGITVPSVLAQKNVILKAWETAKVNPETISYIESHGTGTYLGDPIEIRAIQEAFRSYTQKENFCKIGTLKANLGHLVEASGAAGVVKAVLALQNQALPPSAYLGKINSEINMEHSPITINSKLCEWKSKDEKRRCGVSSFGFSGTNCHLVLEEYKKEYSTIKERQELYFTMSAKQEESLQEYRKKFITFLKKTNESLANICYSSNIGRTHYEKRRIYKIDSIAQLLERLEQEEYTLTESEADDVVCKVYLEGNMPDWSAIYEKIDCWKISMPVYPYRIENFWLKIKNKQEHKVILTGSLDGMYTETQRKVADVIAPIIGLDEIDIHKNLAEEGGDSLTLIDICSNLKKYWNYELKISDIISFPNIAGLASYIDQLGEKGKQEKVVSENSTREKKPQDIAVIGISMRIGNLEEYEDYWNTIINKKIFIGNFPKKREQDIREFLNKLSEEYDNIAFDRGTYLDDISSFDYELFGISYKDAVLMDPSQRLFLQVAIRALTNAGYQIEQLKSRNVGVFTGSSSAAIFNYGKMVFEMEPESMAMAIVPNLPSIIPSRLAYCMDFKGPSMNVDTACSSSMVSLILAVKALRNHECDMAVSGGVRYDLAPVDAPFRKLGVETAQDKIRVFDENSDGTLWGEGTAAVVLKRLEDAKRDGDYIYAVVEGCATNQDGTSLGGISAPNSLAQTNVIERAWADAEINPESIGFIETHGTGTRLGDPIELEGIQRAFDKYTERKQFCAISSVKPNIGHLETASGIVSFITAVLALQHKMIPPTANFTYPNERISFEETAMFLNDIPIPWKEKETIRRCGVSSFGISGTNAHVILREYIEKRKIINRHDVYLLTYSAQTEELLEDTRLLYFSYLKNLKNEEELYRFCYSVNKANNNFKYRRGIVADSLSDMLEQMTKEKRKESAKNGIEVQIVQEYENGQRVDWNEYYKGEKIPKTAVPAILLKKNKCWITNQENQKITLLGREGDYTKLEYQIAKIWSDTIGLTNIDVTQNFYEIGGHSIAMMRIVNEIRMKLHYEITFTDFAFNGTVEKLASLLEGRERQSMIVEEEKCVPDIQHSYEPFPLTDLQNAYFMGRKDDFVMGGVGSHIYMEIETKYDITRLEKSLWKVINRHPMLHTVFHENGTQQTLQDIPVFQIKRYDCTGLNQEQREERAMAIREEMCQSVIKEEQWPLIEVSAMKLSKEKKLLFIGIDVLIADGSSLMIIGKELMNFYKNPNCQLPKINITMRDYILFTQKQKKKKKYEEDKKYWIEQIPNIPPAPVLSYCIDISECSTSVFKRKTHVFSKDVWMKIQKVARKANVSAVSLLCNAYAEVLGYWANQERFSLNFTMFNRKMCHPDVNLLVGDFTSVLLIPVDMRENDFMKRAIQLQNAVNTALQHSMYDGVELLRELSMRSSQRMQPVMPYVFTSMIYNGEYPWSELGEVRYGVSQTPQVYLDNQVVDENGELRVNWDYVSNIFEEEMISNMFEQYLSLIEYLGKDREE